MTNNRHDDSDDDDDDQSNNETSEKAAAVADDITLLDEGRREGEENEPEEHRQNDQPQQQSTEPTPANTVLSTVDLVLHLMGRRRRHRGLRASRDRTIHHLLLNYLSVNNIAVRTGKFKITERLSALTRVYDTLHCILTELISRKYIERKAWVLGNKKSLSKIFSFYL